MEEHQKHSAYWYLSVGRGASAGFVELFKELISCRVGVQLDVRLTSTTVEVLHKGRRIAGYPRSYVAGGFTTCHEHRPKSHQKNLGTPSRIIAWASRKGPSTAALVAKILERRPHPEQGYRSCLGIIRLANRFSDERVEAASARALRCNAIGYQSAKSRLDRQPLKEAPAYTPAEHANIRGADYYRN